MAGEFLSHGHQSMHAHMDIQQNPLMDLTTEVLDNTPGVTEYVQREAMPFIRRYLDRVAEIRLIQESGSNKGTLGSQLAVAFLTDLPLEGHLEANGRTLDLGYLSTKMIIVAGEKNGRITNPPGQRTEKEFIDAGKDAAEVLLTAKTELLAREPDKTHVIFVELVPGVGHFQVGTEIIVAKEEPHLQEERIVFDGNVTPEEHPNSRFNIIGVTNSDILQRSYLQRRALEQLKAQGGEEGKAVAAEFRTAYDMNPLEVLETMGPSTGIERLCGYMNIDMLQAFAAGKFDLPEDTPEKLLEKDDPRKMQGRTLEQFFEALTIFNNGDMETHPLRPWLQYDYYKYLAQEVWKLRSYVIIRPMFLEDTDIHVYPNLLRRYALPFQEFLTIAQERNIEQNGIVSDSVLRASP